MELQTIQVRDELLRRTMFHPVTNTYWNSYGIKMSYIL